MAKTFQIPVILEKVESLSDKGWRIRLQTNELQPEEIGLLGSFHQKYIWVAFSDEAITAEDFTDNV